VQTFSLAGASSANTNYDIYLYNSGTALNPTLAVEYVAWPGNQTPPTRGNQNGVLVRNGNPARRLVGVLRTISAGTSTIDLGGTILGANSANFPKIYLSNLYNLYDARAIYFFGNSWNVPSIPWAVAPSSVYSTAPRVSWVQASSTLVTAFLDIYNNPVAGGNTKQDGVIAYVAPGINATTFPDPTAFYGECSYENQTAGSQWAGALNPGLNDIYYLYRQFANSLSGTDDRSAINEHAAHGMIVTVKV
jgi:hypothetical protein